MKTLRARLDWVMQQRGWSKNRWAQLAGVNRDALRQAYKRAEDATEDISLTVDLLVKLADSASLSVQWLATGKGDIAAQPDLDPDRYPSRALAVGGAVMIGVHPEAIRRVREIDHLPQDPGVDYWMQLLLAENRVASLHKAQS